MVLWRYGTGFEFGTHIFLGTMVLFEPGNGKIGAAGLVGGALIGDLIEHHEDNEREEAYEDGEFRYILLT